MRTPTPLRVACLVVLGLCSTACVSRDFPTHEGGKRFYREQQLLSVAIDEAVAAMQLDRITDAAVRGGDPAGSGTDGLRDGIGLAVFAMADRGAGPGDVASAAANAETGTEFGSLSSADLDYLKGRVVQRILESKIRFDPTPLAGSAMLKRGAIVVTVGELGIDRSGLQALLFSSDRLTARVQLNAWYVRQGETGEPVITPLFEDETDGIAHSGRYVEWFLFGFGPINDAAPRFERVERID